MVEEKKKCLNFCIEIRNCLDNFIQFMNQHDYNDHGEKEQLDDNELIRDDVEELTNIDSNEERKLMKTGQKNLPQASGTNKCSKKTKVKQKAIKKMKLVKKSSEEVKKPILHEKEPEILSECNSRLNYNKGNTLNRSNNLEILIDEKETIGVLTNTRADDTLNTTYSRSRRAVIPRRRSISDCYIIESSTKNKQASAAKKTKRNPKFFSNPFAGTSSKKMKVPLPVLPKKRKRPSSTSQSRTAILLKQIECDSSYTLDW